MLRNGLCIQIQIINAIIWSYKRLKAPRSEAYSSKLQFVIIRGSLTLFGFQACITPSRRYREQHLGAFGVQHLQEATAAFPSSRFQTYQTKSIIMHTITRFDAITFDRGEARGKVHVPTCMRYSCGICGTRDAVLGTEHYVLHDLRGLLSFIMIPHRSAAFWPPDKVTDLVAYRISCFPTFKISFG